MEPKKKNEQMRHAQRRRIEMAFRWPEPPMNIVLVQPAIPPNTGNVSRLCAATGSILHLVGPLGFDISERRVRRAGLDYWDSVDIRTYPDIGNFLERHPDAGIYFFSTAGTRNFQQVEYRPGDYLVFGNESVGLPDDLLAARADRVCNIPIRLDHVRSLNLSNCAAIVLYEALRQIDARAAGRETGGAGQGNRDD